VAAVEYLVAKGERSLVRQSVSAADSLVALRAAALLGSSKPGSRAMVERALADADGQVRAAAIAAVAAIMPRERAVALAAARLEDDQASVRVTAAQALVELGDPRGAEALSALARAADAAVREAAIRGHDRARLLTPGLIAALADESAPNRVLAAELLLDMVD
jgi:HEAT repeat protein